MTDPLLALENVKTHFSTRAGLVRAVDGVSLTLEHGRTLGIVGESGSGKSALARTAMGLSPRHGVVRSGRVLFEGRDISELGRRAMRGLWGNRMAMVFQDPLTSLNPVMTVGAQLKEVLREHLGLRGKEAHEKAESLFVEVGIPDPARRLDEYPKQLSGGLRQRVTIAIALACSPALLLADEPTTALDVTVQAQVLDLLAKQQRQRRMGMVLVTHDLGVAAGRCDEVAVMYAGKIVEQAPTAVLFRSMKMPYTEALVQSTPRLDSPPHTELRVIPGRPPDLINPGRGCRFAPRCSYAQERCRTEEPPLVAADDAGHRYACWYPIVSDTSGPKATALAAGRA